MARFALLIQASPTLEDGNYLRLATCLTASGHAVTLLDVDTLSMSAGRVQARGFDVCTALEDGAPFPAGDLITLDHDIVWVLGLGDRQSFLDKYQLLYAVPGRVINSLDAIMHLKSKYFLATQDEFRCPETHASNDAQTLIDIVRREGGDWIVKPPAGSLGRDVFRVSDEDTNLAAIIEHLCGPENANYTLLQRYVPGIEAGEKRVLIAGGRVIGQYHRRAASDHRNNVQLGAATSACDLTTEERHQCESLAQVLLGRGAFYAGIDLCHPWLIEVNVINPGGLTTIDSLTGEDLAPAVTAAVLAALAPLP